MVEGTLDRLVEGLFSALGLVFDNDFVAPLIILPLMLLAAAFMVLRAWRVIRPFLKAADHRIVVLKDALQSSGGPDAAGERIAFANAFDDVKAAMGRHEKRAEPLYQAWHEFHESIVREDEAPIRNTLRPQVFFERAVPNLGFLAFWGNTFVGLGLLLTFMGVVVALHNTGQSMDADATTATTEAALRTLLIVAAAKFFASIAGLAASLVVRFAEARYGKAVWRRIDDINALLERGFMYVPPQLLSAQQLDELKGQSAQLQRFNTDLALSIGDQVSGRFKDAIATLAEPLAQLDIRKEIATLAEPLAQLNIGIANLGAQFGKGAGDAITGAAGEHLASLGATLQGLRGQLAAVGSEVQSSGGDAANQIKAAADQFSTAAMNIRDAFEALSSKIAGIGDAVAARNEEIHSNHAEARQKDQASFDASRTAFAGVIGGATEALAEAGRRSAELLQAGLDNAVKNSTEEAAKILQDAIAAAGTGFGEAGQHLISAVRDAADQVKAYAEAIDRSRAGAERAATVLDNTATSAGGIAGSLGEAASALREAALPVAGNSRALASAATEMSRSLASHNESAVALLNETRSLSEGIKATQESAEAAWRDYRNRFDGVDRSLGETVERMSVGLGDAIGTLRDFVAQLDRDLADIVGKITTPLDTISELAESIESFAERLPASGAGGGRK